MKWLRSLTRAGSDELYFALHTVQAYHSKAEDVHFGRAVLQEDLFRRDPIEGSHATLDVCARPSAVLGNAHIRYLC